VVARRLNWSPDARLMVRQLAGAWLCGSALMGTVAWGFLSAEGTTAVLVPVPVRAFAPAGTAICPGLPSCGPFALVAGMLLRPWRANVAAGGVSAGLVAAGFLMVAGHPVPQNVFTLYAEYARSFFSGGPSPVLY